MEETTEIPFKAPTKWEQNRLTHSFGELTISNDAINFEPGSVSVPGRKLSIPLNAVSEARKRDNFLWRGAVTIALNDKYENRAKFIFFLGNKYQEFLNIIEHKAGDTPNNELERTS